VIVEKGRADRAARHAAGRLAARRHQARAQEALDVAERAKARERQAQLLEADLRHQLAQIEQARRDRDRRDARADAGELDEARKEIEQTAAAGAQRLHRQRQQPPRTTIFWCAPRRSCRGGKQATEEVNQRVIVPGKAGHRLTGPIEVGDRVWVASLQASGEVLAVYDASDEADVQLGNFRLKLPHETDGTAPEGRQGSSGAAVKIRSSSPAPSPGMELDLRGERVEEGLERLERYLNDAYRARLPWVRIIHGHGTGAMRPRCAMCLSTIRW
jgi:DNA mismatch repair protein MutS2